VRKYVIDPNEDFISELRTICGDDMVQFEKVAV